MKFFGFWTMQRENGTPTRPSAGSAQRDRPSSAAPSFGRLILTALRSVGIDYISLDHLRRAKKDDLTEHEYVLLWKLLHDVVLVVLLDFQIDADAMRQEHMRTEVGDPTLLSTWQELVRFYLYDWGFVGASLYDTSSPSPSSVLLLAFAWLLARSQLVRRQQNAILQLYLDSTDANLPPYANDVVVPPTVVANLVGDVVTDNHQLQQALDRPLDMTGRLHQLQALVGRIHTHRRSLQASMRAFRRMLQRVQDRQREVGADEDQLIPAYAAQVLVSGKARIELHIRMINERLAMVDDEKLFYKWINGLLLQHKPTNLDANSSDTNSVDQQLAHQHEGLHREIIATQQLLQHTAPLLAQLGRLLVEETNKWKSKPKTRTQQTRMDDKMAKLREDVIANELVDVRTLLVDRSNSTITPLVLPPPNEVTQYHSEQLSRLQDQLEKVMGEITTQYCHAALV